MYDMLDKHLYIPLIDSGDAKLIPHLQPAWAFIDKQLKEDKNVLVHCKMGISRSPALVCAYLMKIPELPFEKCY